MPLSPVARFLTAIIFCCAFLTGPAQTQEAAPAVQPNEALNQLIDVLRDDGARQVLIEELERLSSPQDAPPPAEAPIDETIAETEAEPEPQTDHVLVTPSSELRSLGGRIADFTKDAAEDVATSIEKLWRQLANAPSLLRGLERLSFATLQGIALNLASLVIITYGGLIVLRWLSRPWRRRLSEIFGEGGWVAKPFAIVSGLALDIAIALVPWALGYGFAIVMLDSNGAISFAHSLYLNAFIMAEIPIAIVRRIVSPRHPEQRLVAISSRQAELVKIWSRVLIMLFVFGQLLILPLLNRTVSYLAGRSVSVLLILLTLALASIAILLARGAVARMLLKLFERAKTRRFMRGLIIYWHIPALLYIGALAIAALVRTPTAFQAILWANAQVALAVLAGLIVLHVLSRIIGHGVHLPEHVNQRMPLLERQLNAFVPVTLSTLRFLIGVGVVIFCLHMLGMIDFMAFLESQVGARMTGSVITVLLIVFFAFLFWMVINSWVDYRINPTFSKRITARERTLLVLLRNALTIAIIVVTLMVVLSELGLNIAPLLASAGVIGLAIGFGAQKLVQDIITGIFIQLEGAIDVGDVVSVAGISGVVERLTIRSVSLRDSEGSFHIIPFSTVGTVTNFMRGFSFAVLDMSIAYRENTDDARQAMTDAFDILRDMQEHKSQIIADFDWIGVNALSPSEVVMRARIKTKPGKQWGVKRAYNTIVRRIFVERGIEVPSSSSTVYIGVDPLGEATPLEATKIETPKPSKRRPKPDPEPKPAPRRRKPASDEIDLPDPDSGPDS